MDSSSPSWLNKKTLSIFIAVAVGAGIALFYMKQQQAPQAEILKYSYERDAANVEALFKKEMYWLIAQKEAYPLHRMLEEQTPPSRFDPKYQGKLYIKVLQEQGHFAGFSAYFMETESEGRLLFLSIDANYRQKGYARKLIEDAMADLKALGARTIVVCCRTANYRAEALYKRLGFHETDRSDDGFINFVYTV